MSRLVRLYPRAWRDRYEDEFIALLEERPPTPRDVLDTIRGAFDAHLHPTAADADPMPWTYRVPGLLTLLAGVLWSGLYLNAARDPATEWGGILTTFMFVVFFSLPGDYMAPYSGRIVTGLMLFFSSLILANVAGWNVIAFALYGFAFVLAICGPLALAAIRAGIGPRGRCLLLGGALVLPVVIALSVSALRHYGGVTLFPDESPAAYLLVLPYGLSWVFLGLRMTIRGSPTIVDPRPDTLESTPEVRPA